MKNVKIEKCPFCGGTHFTEGKQEGYGAMCSIKHIFRTTAVYYTICVDCGSIVRSYIRNPERFAR